MTKNIIHENYNGMTLTNDIALLQVGDYFKQPCFVPY